MAHILVVDDEQNTVRFLALAVHLLGHKRIEGHNGPQAIQLFIGSDPEVVSLDHLIPGMNGIEKMT